MRTRNKIKTGASSSKTKRRQHQETCENLDSLKAKWISQEEFKGREDLDVLCKSFEAFVKSALKSFINDTRKPGFNAYASTHYPTYQDDQAKNIIRKLGLVHPTKSEEQKAAKSNATGVMETCLDSKFSQCPKVNDAKSIKKIERLKARNARSRRTKTRQTSNVVEDESNTGEAQEDEASTESSNFEEDVQEDVSAVLSFCEPNTERSLVAVDRKTDNPQKLDLQIFNPIDTERIPVPTYWRMILCKELAMETVYRNFDGKDREAFRHCKSSTSNVHDSLDREDLRSFKGLKLSNISEDGIKQFLDATRPKIDRQVLFVDKPTLKGLRMPIMPPPAPMNALRQCRSVSVYTNLSSYKPDRMPWCSSKLGASSLRHMQNYAKQKVTGDLVSRASEAVYTVSLYKPVKMFGEISRFIPSPELPGLACKIQILGQQSLGDLREHLYCSTDFLDDEIKVDFVENLDSDMFGLPQNHRAKFIDNPCGFVIGDHVYGNNPGREFRKDASFVQANMHTTRIDSLELKLGFPYVFIHNDTCEHVIVFEEASLLKPQNPVVRKSAYPKLTSYKLKTKYCDLDMSLARYAVRDNTLENIPSTPLSLCHNCMVASCYSGGMRLQCVSVRPYVADPRRNHLTAL